MNNKTILVIAEYLDGKLNPITDELIACAIEIKKIFDLKAKDISEVNVLYEIKVIHFKGINSLESEKYKSFLFPIIREINPSFILMGHTSQGIDIASGLAVRIGCNCITNINKIIYSQPENIDGSEGSKSNILFSRSVFKGKFNTIVGVENLETIILLTIQSGSFYIKDCCKEYNNIISNEECYLSNVDDSIISLIEYGDIVYSCTTNSKLNEAKVIVACGRGIGDKENIEYIKKMAACFTGSAVAGSRPLIDMGWLPYEQQVGITGAIVSPELYLAVGISGSSQHIAGMKDSKFIVSVNKDPNAAIFNFSDISIVEDCLSFIEEFIYSKQA
ncbi:MAG: electron transfer flavoprotein subunit alpha/FixB family protein [Desulfamplus sp.]|nr:electron transfer flavoprotein subunit alpha/FixB family protein [Desulfamplus sp.]